VKLHVEGSHAPEHGEADAACGDGAEVHAFNIIRALDAISDVPAAVDYLLVGGDEVADEREDLHAHVLGDRDTVAEGDLSDGRLAVSGSFKIDMVRTNAGSHAKLEVGGHRETFGGDVRGPERLRNNDVGIDELLLKVASRAVPEKNGRVSC
jgi:hypothetical protein